MLTQWWQEIFSWLCELVTLASRIGGAWIVFTSHNRDWLLPYHPATLTWAPILTYLGEFEAAHSIIFGDTWRWEDGTLQN